MILRILALSALTALPVAALPVASMAQQAAIQPQTVISAVTGDWNNDGGMDRAVLVDNGDDGADLLIYLSDGDNNMKLASSAKSFVWNGAVWGTLPQLQLSSSGGLQVHAENTGSGRDHWDQVYNLSLRDGKMVVAGLTETTNDTLDPNGSHKCDINFLSGKGTSDGKAVSLSGPAPDVASWTQDSVPDACQF